MTLALVLEGRAMAIGEWHGEVVRHAFGHTGLAYLVCHAIQDDELAVQALAGADAGVAMLEQFADGGGAFQQPRHE